MTDTLDLISYDEALAAIGNTNADIVSPLDAELERMVTAVSRQVDRDWGPMVVRPVTAIVDGGYDTLLLETYPISSITSVAERSGTTQTTITAENYAAPTSSDYLLEADSGRLIRRSGGADACWAAGRRNVTVVYVAGRYATTATVDAHVKEAAQIAVEHVWKMSKGLGSPMFGGTEDSLSTGWPAPFTIPRASASLLGPRQPKVTVFGA